MLSAILYLALSTQHPALGLTMILIPPPPYRKRRSVRLAPDVAPPPAPLELVAAIYTEMPDTRITLSFNRAIDISSMDASQIFVFDSVESGRQWAGTGGTLIDPLTVRIDLTDVGRSLGFSVFLNALADSNILAVGDADAWSGVEGLELPFP